MIVETAIGMRFGCDDLGDPRAPAVVLIGGLATQRTVWPDALCDALVGAGFRVVRFDNRDVGESSWMQEPSGPALQAMAAAAAEGRLAPPYTLDDMAADTVALMDALEIVCAHIVGMSMGGRIAQLVAADRPQRARSLVSIMSTTGHPTLPPPTPAALAALTMPPDDPFDVEAVTRLAIAQQAVIGSPGFPMPDAYVRKIVALNFARGNNPQGVLRQWLASSLAGDLSGRLSRIVAPTLVVHGADDPLVPPACGRDTARRIAGAELRIVDGMGHNIPPALCPLLGEVMLSFLERAEKGP